MYKVAPDHRARRVQVDGESNPKLFELPTTRRLENPRKPRPVVAEKLKVPTELADIIKGGKRMERERTLMDCGVGFGHSHQGG